MKKTLLIAFALAVFTGASAQLKFAENFGGMTAGNLGTQNSWVQSGSGNDLQVTVLSNNTGALVYPGYASGQNYITADNVDGRDSYKPFNANVSTGSASTTFISFLVRVTGSGNTTIEDLTLPSLALRTTDGNNLGYFYIADDGGSTNLKFGIAKNEGLIGDGSYASANFAFNTTYWIVIRYDVVTGSNNDRIYLWVNHSPVINEPATGSAAHSITSGDDGGYSGSISAMQLFQNRFSFGLTWSSAEASFDAFRVANRPTSAAAWLDLSPSGAPLPVTIGSIKAYEKQAGIQLDWTSFSELNLSHYEIERSADGRNFAPIGQVSAANSTAAKNYGFLDASPLPGTSYYRLKNVDIDTKAEYSSVVRVSLDKSVKDVRLYPNPVTAGYVAFQSSDLAKGDYAAKIFNAAGQQVHILKFTHTGGSINQTIQLPATVKTGMYTLLVDKNGEKVITRPFMVQ